MQRSAFLILMFVMLGWRSLLSLAAPPDSTYQPFDPLKYEHHISGARAWMVAAGGLAVVSFDMVMMSEAWNVQRSAARDAGLDDAKRNYERSRSYCTVSAVITGIAAVAALAIGNWHRQQAIYMKRYSTPAPTSALPHLQTGVALAPGGAQLALRFNL
jgi:hypothetical protein